MANSSGQGIPNHFIFRRLHSIFGLLLTGYIIVHLFTNSQAALWIGDDGKAFIKAVNAIHEIPFLTVIEVLVLGLPILVHAIWGVIYLRTAKYNSFGPKDGTEPYLPEYPRNHAYTWQRITSWILLFGIAAHVVHMRFFEEPYHAGFGLEQVYFLKVESDPGLSSLAKRLHIALLSQEELLDMERVDFKEEEHPLGFERLLSEVSHLFTTPLPDVKRGKLASKELGQAFMEKAKNISLDKTEVLAVTRDFGTAELLMLRETFKMPIMLALYTVFVLAACFHGFNGLWTFAITWGVTLTQRSQQLMRHLCTGLMLIVLFFGLSAIWLTYLVNLRQ